MNIFAGLKKTADTNDDRKLQLIWSVFLAKVVEVTESHSTSFKMSAGIDGDTVDNFLVSLHSSLSPINLIEEVDLFAADTTVQSFADNGSTSTDIDVSDHLDSCSANTYVYKDFTQTEWVRAGFIVLYVIIIVLSVVGNFMVIWTIARNRHMRTTTNYYILNLAVADFLVALVVMPLKLTEYTAPCQWHVFSRHNTLCPMLYYILPVFVFTSVLTLAAISVERSVTSESFSQRIRYNATHTIQ